MDSRLELTTLPLDTPDDDPRWHGWQDQIQLGFLDPDLTDEFRALFRDGSRSCAQRLRGVLDPDALLPDMPVATFTSGDQQLNVGHGRTLPANMIIDVTVRATHRRRGILRELMTLDLAEARERGCALAALTASEGSIYGRFGFGVGTRLGSGSIDGTRFQLRRPPSGSVDYVRPADVGEYYDRIYAAWSARERGGFGPWPHIRAQAVGEFSWNTKAANKRLFAIVHRDEAGEVDGYATYEPVPDSDPGTVSVKQLLANTPEAEIALWAFLASLDLVDRLTYLRFRLDDPLQAALVNPRALSYDRVYDMVWLRILDPVRALAERGWDRDGDLVLCVEDPMGFAAGTFRIAARDGRAEVTPTDAAPDATVDAETLAQLYLGGISGASLAGAGRIAGDARRVTRLFAVDDEPFTPFGF